MKTHRHIGFLDSLDEDDYGIMLSHEGRIKGIWIPRIYDTEPVPAAVVELCLTNFGIDPNKDIDISQTVH